MHTTRQIAPLKCTGQASVPFGFAKETGFAPSHYPMTDQLPVFELQALFFQVFQIVSLRSVHIPVFFAPPIKGLERNIYFSRGFFDAHPLDLLHISFA